MLEHILLRSGKKKGHDLGTTVSKVPSNLDIIQMAKKVLNMSCSPMYPLCDPSSTKMTKVPPPIFNTTFDTSEGKFTIHVNTSWSPHAASRFYNLVSNGWYNNTYFFRVIKSFVNEFGLSGNPLLQQHYCNDVNCTSDALFSGAAIEQDTGPLVGDGNVRGTVAFSLMSSGGNASVEIFINLNNNQHLNADGFRPFGIVIENGMNVVDMLYSGYGELNEPDLCPDPTIKLCKGPVLKTILKEGNQYLKTRFPKMSKINFAWVI